ncbi:MAG: pyruvate kinase [Anaerolineae bacterium]|jgi:pyruvate kinase|nr:MAG: pyruvate kinase [Anaerolineae bacterium]
MVQKTKIIATLGPASSDFTTLSELIRAGVRIFRVNCSHGSESERICLVQRAKQVSESLAIPIAVLIDLQGPKIRIGELEKPSITLQSGRRVIITDQPVQGNEKSLSIELPGLFEHLQVGHRILLDDGKIELKVIQKGKNTLETEVIVGGALLPRKGANFPDSELPLSGITQKDLRDLQVGLQNSIDAVALSFVQNGQDILDLRKQIKEKFPTKKDVPIIAKIERPQALLHLSDILEQADGVMVARGDLAIEISPACVPTAQKQIITTANRLGKYVITATQMLESMIENAVPTRAEANDVANAVFDGSDAVMLSAETSIGKHPIRAVQTMVSIIEEAEKNLAQWSVWNGKLIPKSEDEDSYYVIQAAHDLSEDRNVTAICVFTQSGRTASLLSKTRPKVPIYAFTPNPDTHSRLSLFWGVESILTPRANSLDEILAIIQSTLRQQFPIKSGDQAVLICGYPVHQFRSANLLMLYTVP